MPAFTLERCGIVPLILKPHVLRCGVNIFLDFQYQVTLKQTKKKIKAVSTLFSVYKRTERCVGLHNNSNKLGFFMNSYSNTI